MRLRSSRDRNHDDEPTPQRRRQRNLCDPRQRLGIAVPDEGEAVDEEVCNVDIPWLNHAIASSGHTRMIEAEKGVQVWMR